MTRHTWFLLFLLASSHAAEQPEVPSPHQQFVIGISPFLDRSVKDGIYRGIVRLVIEELPLDSTLTVYDAFHLQSITEVTLPKLKVFTSPKTRANQFAPAIQSLKLFLAKDHPKPTNAHLNFDGAIRLPQFCEFLADHRSTTNALLSLLLLGSPLYQDAKEPAFSMVDGYFPSDGHLLASRDESVFGWRGQTNTIRPLLAHWVYFGDPWLNDLHQEKVTRFWTLFLERRGAQLATFSGDPATALSAFRQRSNGLGAATSRWVIDANQSKIEMLRISRNVEVTDWITRETLADPAPQAPRTFLGRMKIGIRWREKIDLDLYATPRPDAETLFFEHPRSRDGFYYKDYRSSPGREYEFIEFESMVDVRTVEAFVNFYEGSCPGGAQGEVRIEFDGRIYSAPFSVPAAHGNLGRSGRGQQDFWTRVPVQEMLKIHRAG